MAVAAPRALRDVWYGLHENMMASARPSQIMGEGQSKRRRLLGRAVRPPLERLPLHDAILPHLSSCASSHHSPSLTRYAEVPRSLGTRILASGAGR